MVPGTLKYFTDMKTLKSFFSCLDLLESNVLYALFQVVVFAMVALILMQFGEISQCFGFIAVFVGCFLTLFCCLFSCISEDLN